MTLRSLIGVGLMWAVGGAVYAQDAAPADPVLANFREYRAALERGDTAAAETAAQAAYDASVAANGNRTAVLALNLATLRLDLGKPNTAYAPAQKAHELATADPDSGVDPLLAALTFGRAALTVDGMQAAPALLEALKQAERRGELPTETYSAWVDLARQAFARKDYGIARDAWAASARLAANAPDRVEFARGLARAGEGAAIFMQAIVESDGEAISRGAARDANEAFGEALRLLQTYTEDTDPSVLTVGQAVYAQALAWHSALRAKTSLQGNELPANAAVAQPAGGRCAVRLIAEPPPVYPSEALAESGVGSVVIRVTTDAEGQIIDRKVAATVPSGPFSESVAAVAAQWRVEVAPDAVPGCRRDGTQYTPILFVAD
jgi:TonB family protein